MIGEYGTVIQGKNISIQFVDNGWIVVVKNHYQEPDRDHKMMKGVAATIAQVNSLAGSGFIRGVDEAADPYKENDEERLSRMKAKAELVQKAIDNAFAEPQKVFKPVEVYAFLEFEKMIAFLRETLAFKV